MNELDRLINQLIKEKGGTRQQYLHLLDTVAAHETGGTFDPTTKQLRGDNVRYGSGLYQFETGSNQGGITAARRTETLYKKRGYAVPTWLKEAIKGNTLEAANLTPEQQSVLFLANHREHPKSDYSQIWDGKQSISEFWSKNHQADPNASQRREKEKKFAKDQERFEVKNEPFLQKEIDRTTPSIDNNSFQQELSKNDIYASAKVYADENKFDPEGTGYDYITAKRNGMTPDKTGHWSSREPNTGQILKGRQHKTYPLTVQGEINAGYTINKGKDGKYYSQNQKADGGPIGPQPQQTVVKTRPDYNTYTQQIPEYDTVAPYIDKAQPLINKTTGFEQKTKQEFNDWYNNPITRKRLSEQTNYNPNQINNMLANAASTKMNRTNKVGLNENAEYIDKTRQINYNIQNPNVVKHELTHASGLDQQLGEYLLKTTGYPSEQKTNYLGEVQNYMAKPHEAYGNFNEFRSALGWKPGQQIKDAAALEKLMKQKKVDTNYSRTFDKENIVKALNTVADNSSISNQNMAALGGDLSHLKQNTNNPLYRRNFTSFGVGGLHSQNPLGGVPIGMGANGKPNTVEQGEAAYNFKAGKFIFSNRIKI
jgi:hypothetical protein